MKVIILVFALIAVAAAAPPPLAHFDTRSEHHTQQSSYQARSNDASKNAKILRYESEQGLGAEGYKYAIQTSDGIEKEEQGVLENAGTDQESLRVVGRFLYPGGPNGELLLLEYIADKDGFQPKGDHLPKPVAPLH